MLWEAKDRKLSLGPGSSILRVGERLLTLSDRGKLSICLASPQEIKLLAQADLLDAREVFAAPLLYGGRLYAKGDTELVCFDLSGKPGPQTQPHTQPQTEQVAQTQAAQ